MQFRVGRQIAANSVKPLGIFALAVCITGGLYAQPTSATVGADPGPAPEGMVWVPSGEFWMGSEDPEFADARPVHKVALDGFWMDKTEVTNAQFAEFVQATNYVTVAEQRPDPKDFPGAPLESLVPGAIVFTPPANPVDLDEYYSWWQYVPGANWKHPEGPGSSTSGRENYPVVHVAYPDAVAYATWAEKRLPTEAEWEYAARGGLDRQPYVWGTAFAPKGKQMANTFQGHFPDKPKADDGYNGTAPVSSYPPNGFGLYDMAGNVWEWCSDWYRPDTYNRAGGEAVRNPKGPDDSFDPAESGALKRVQKGGSLLCSDQYCSRYKPGGRGKGEVNTGTSHVGFRCVKDGHAGP